MSSSPDWLQRLSHATTFAELREAYQQMAVQAEANLNQVSFADLIDQAIQQLVAERSRDERELAEVQGRYESFREDNRGVVGWFKRHLPFTETRRQELDHKSDVADQSAEILADNLVIARAQIIKERLLPPDRRRLGNRVAEWQSRWERERSRPPAAGAVLGQLHAELERSRAFVAELKQDIEAFGQAAFREAEDRQRRDTDLAEARRELETLHQEISAEQSLLQEGLRLLTGHVAVELTATDPEFRRDGEQLEKLQLGLTRLAESRAAMAKLTATVGQISQVHKQLQSWPEQMRQAQEAVAKLATERTAAEQQHAAKTQIIAERQARVSDAQRSLDQATLLLRGVQPAYDAHCAQRQAQQSMPMAVEAEPPSPIEQQYQTARSMVDQAQALLREAQASVDAIRRETTQAEAATKAATEKLAAEQRKLSESEGKEKQLRAELAGHAERGQREFAAAASALAAFLQLDRAGLSVPPYRPMEIGAGTYGWLGTHGMERALATALLQPASDAARQAQAVTTLERLSQWQETQLKALEQEQSQARTRRESVWKRRCRELLGEKLGEQACQKGLASAT